MKDFEKIIWRNALTLVDFFASWCGPCRMLAPTLDRFAREMNGRVDVWKINIESPEMAEAVRRYNIRSVPTLILFRRGEILWRHSGVLSYDELTEMLRKLELTEHPIE